MAKHTLDQDYALTAPPGDPDARAVAPDDPAARYVLGGEGAEIEEADARRYGLLGDASSGPEAEAPERESDAGGKALDGAPEDKAVRRAARK